MMTAEEATSKTSLTLFHRHSRFPCLILFLSSEVAKKKDMSGGGGGGGDKMGKEWWCCGSFSCLTSFWQPLAGKFTHKFGLLSIFTSAFSHAAEFAAGHMDYSLYISTK